jgi:two-component system LytT family response regulator
MKKENVNLSRIIYLKADSNYTEFHFTCGKKHLSPRTLKHHQNKQEMKDFLRVNNSLLLNPSYIDCVSKRNSTSIVKLTNGMEVVASRRRQNVLQAYKHSPS